MKTITNKVIALTGAGGGIGRALAVLLHSHGAELALSDINPKSLEETVQLLNSSPKVTSHVVDVSSYQSVEEWSAKIVEQHGHVDAIINNAGAVACGLVESISLEDMHWVIDVTMWGVVHGVKAFLPYLKTRPQASIVNISSLNAFVPFSANSPYNMAKSAVKGLSETLMQELRTSPVTVTCVHPGGIKTGIVRNARNTSDDQKELFDEVAMTTAEAAALAIVKGMRRRKKRLLVGWDAKLLILAKRILPMTTVWGMGRWLAKKKNTPAV